MYWGFELVYVCKACESLSVVVIFCIDSESFRDQNRIDPIFEGLKMQFIIFLNLFGLSFLFSIIEDLYHLC